MKNRIKLSLSAALGVLALSATLAQADDDKIVVGFATAVSGFMQAYDKPAQDAAMIRIDEINQVNNTFSHFDQLEYKSEKWSLLGGFRIDHARLARRGNGGGQGNRRGGDSFAWAAGFPGARENQLCGASREFARERTFRL